MSLGIAVLSSYLAASGVAPTAQPAAGADETDTTTETTIDTTITKTSQSDGTRADPALAPPRWKGTGMLIGSGIMMAGVGWFKVLTTGAVVDTFVRPCRDTPEACGQDKWGAAFGIAVVDTVGVPTFGVALGLLGGGLAKRARWRAHRDLRSGTRTPFDLKRRTRLGWALLGAGAGTMVASLAGLRCESGACWMLVHEVGQYTAIGLMSAGVALTASSRAYSRAESEFRVGAAMLPGGGGISISGRF